MKNPENKKYIKLGITGVAVVVIGLLFFFLLFRFESLSAGLYMVLGILTPFVYGAVIAYILTPVCNRIERLLGKLLGKNRCVPALSIVLALVFALALVLVLVMLVFPQVWASIVSIANAIPGQLAAANTWLHDLLESRPDLQI